MDGGKSKSTCLVVGVAVLECFNISAVVTGWLVC